MSRSMIEALRTDVNTALDKIFALRQRLDEQRDLIEKLVHATNSVCAVYGHRSTVNGFDANNDPLDDGICRRCGKVKRPEAWVDPEPQEAAE